MSQVCQALLVQYREAPHADLPPLCAILAWARQLPPDAPVGRTCSSYDCPLSHALHALCGGTWDVESEGIRNFTARKRYPSPAAYAALVQAVDALDGSSTPGIPLHRVLEAATFVALIRKVLLAACGEKENEQQ